MDAVEAAFSELKLLRKRYALTPAIVAEVAPFLTRSFGGSPQAVIDRLRHEAGIYGDASAAERPTECLILREAFDLYGLSDGDSDFERTVQTRLMAVASLVSSDPREPRDPMTGRRHSDRVLLRIASDIFCPSVETDIRGSLEYFDSARARFWLKVDCKGEKAFIPQMTLFADDAPIPLVFELCEIDKAALSPAAMFVYADVAHQYSSYEVTADFVLRGSARLGCRVDVNSKLQSVKFDTRGGIDISSLSRGNFVSLRWRVARRAARP